MLLTDALGIQLSFLVSNKYWNNDCEKSLERLLLNICENTYFYPKLIKNESKKMAWIFLITLIAIVILIRKGSVELIEWAVLIVFCTDFVFLKLFRMNWMILKFQNCFDRANKLARDWSNVDERQQWEVIDILCEYETIKARGGYRPADATFRKLNRQLTSDWQEIRLLINPRQK